jgi:UrcA family protein
MIIRSTFAAALVLGTVAFAAPAVAANAAPTVEVSTKGLDLKSPEGMTALTHRIQAAARAVCPASDAYDLGSSIKQRQCYKKAVAGAQTQVASLRGGQQVALYVAK